jgi:hypothetical protein
VVLRKVTAKSSACVARRQGSTRWINPEKNRLAKTVVDRWCSFHEALGATKRKYPTREFLSFAEAGPKLHRLGRAIILIHRDVANTINGLAEFFRLERKRMPGENSL